MLNKRKRKKMLYFAYGSNLDVLQMQSRCPESTPVGSAYFPNWKLVFRGVADIVPEEGAMLPVGIWEVTDKCLQSLDIYEGVKSGLYRRVNINGMISYRMNGDYIQLPADFYYEGIQRGYFDFDLDETYLWGAYLDAKRVTEERENV